MQTVSRTAPRWPALSCWCDCGDYTVAFRTRRFGLLRCQRCGSFRVNPPAIRDAAASATFYSAYYEGSAPPATIPAAASSRRSRFWRVVERAQELHRVGRTVVDIGCGDGQLCAELVAHGWPEVIGTVAGDNTLLLIIKPKSAVDEVLRRLRDAMGR